VVHDVRQMLAVITGRSGLLLRGSDHEVIRENLKAIETAATQANATLSRLLSRSKTSSVASCDIFQMLIQSSTLTVPEPGTFWIRGDRPQGGKDGAWYLGGNITAGCFTSVPGHILLEVLNNLLLNSLQVMPNGGELQVELKLSEKQWCLRLQDSGPGIPPELHHKIFELGFSSSGDAQRGVGLAGSRDLLVQYGGTLELGSTEHSGACFELLLPFASEPEGEIPADEVLTQDSFRPNVLIVDDDQAVREMLNDVFEELGCLTKVARDAPGATEIFPTESFKMVVIDQNLPGISGLEFAEGLRRRDPNVILVLISGWGQKEILDKALGSVVDLVGEKPITVEKIMEMLNQAGALHRQRLEGS